MNSFLFFQAKIVTFFCGIFSKPKLWFFTYLFFLSKNDFFYDFFQVKIVTFFKAKIVTFSRIFFPSQNCGFSKLRLWLFSVISFLKLELRLFHIPSILVKIVTFFFCDIFPCVFVNGHDWNCFKRIVIITIYKSNFDLIRNFVVKLGIYIFLSSFFSSILNWVF